MAKTLIVFVVIAQLSVSAMTTARESSSFSILPDGEGREIVAAQCGVCHSLKLVVANRMNRDGWLSTIRWMQKKHNLWTFSGQMEEAILKYLSTALGPPPHALDMDGLLGPRLVNPLPKLSD